MDTRFLCPKKHSSFLTFSPLLGYLSSIVEMIEVEADEELEQDLEHALQKFEAWAAQIRPLLDQEGYEPSYEDKRMACIVLGLHATVYPDNDTYPHRADIEIAPPSVMTIVSPISRNS